MNHQEQQTNPLGTAPVGALLKPKEADGGLQDE